MSDRQFTLSMSDAERLMVLHALGFMLVKLPTTPLEVNQAVVKMISKLSDSPGVDAKPEQIPMGGTEAARAILERPAVPRVPQDYFQPNKKGQTQTKPPEGAELSTVRIVSVRKQKMDAKYWTVIFGLGTTSDGATRPAGKASCWDPSIAQELLLAEGKSAQVWILESGNYLNIVGVRA